MTEPQKAQEFVKLWTGESRRIYAYIMALHPNAADVDELFQETALTVWEKFDKFEPETNFRAWACKIARNKVGSFWQLRRHSELNFGEDFPDVVDKMLALKTDILDAQHEALADCFAKLCPRDQDLVELRYQDGATVKKVAHQAKRSVDAIYKALNRIHMALLECVSNSTAHMY